MSRENSIQYVLRIVECDLRTFANFLMISKTALREVIAGSLKMPEKSRTYCEQLHEQLQSKEVRSGVLEDYLASEENELEDFKKEQASLLADKLLLLEMKLAEMETKYNSSLAILQNLSYIKITATGKIGTMQKHWHEVLVDKQLSILEKVGLVKQEELRRKIAGVRAGME